MKVRDLIAHLEQLDGDTLIVTAKYDIYCGEWVNIRSIEPDVAPTIFVEPRSERTFTDVTDKERERDQLAVVI